MFKGLRGLVFGSALISFAAAATLALNLPASAWAGTADVWCVLIGLSGAITIVSCFALVRSLIRQ